MQPYLQTAQEQPYLRINGSPPTLHTTPRPRTNLTAASLLQPSPSQQGHRAEYLFKMNRKPDQTSPVGPGGDGRCDRGVIEALCDEDEKHPLTRRHLTRPCHSHERRETPWRRRETRRDRRVVTAMDAMEAVEASWPRWRRRGARRHGGVMTERETTRRRHSDHDRTHHTTRMPTW